MEKSKKKFEDYEIEGWVRTLQEAESIKKDPEKMRLLAPKLKKQISSLDELRDLIEEKNSSSDEGESEMEDSED